jgi:putative ABC transport system permease protein
MKIFESLRIAMRALAANKLRSILTMLGIIIGVGAVIALMSLGRGVEKFVTDQFAGLGSNLLFITPGQISDGPPTLRQGQVKLLTLSDMNALLESGLAPDVKDVSGVYQGAGKVERGGQEMSITVNATTPDFDEVRNWKTILGEFFTQDDFDQRQRVILLGTEVYDELFPGDEFPVDQTVALNGMNFRVIGVMESKGGGGPGGSQDRAVFLPLTTAQDRLFKQKTVSGDYGLNVIYASVVSKDRVDAAQEEIATLMRERRGIEYLDQDDFAIFSQADIISVFGDILGALTVFLGAIAAISLVVGGIGIMNIMLVSVTERTREIGLRKAVGAKRADVLIQFLIESMTLSAFGGAIGVAVGWGLAELVRTFSGFQAVVGVDAIVLSLVVSTAVGLFFGIFPAYRASRLNPIDALRYE